jgi:hypothetical protein
MAEDETARVPASRAELGPLAQTLRRPREVLKCVDWMLEHDEPVAANLWDEVYRIAMHSRSHRAKLHAIRILADRFDPTPRAPTVQLDAGPVTITWQSPSTTAPAPFRPGFTTPSTPTALEPRASSATDVLEKL